MESGGPPNGPFDSPTKSDSIKHMHTYAAAGVLACVLEEAPFKVASIAARHPLLLI